MWDRANLIDIGASGSDLTWEAGQVLYLADSGDIEAVESASAENVIVGDDESIPMSRQSIRFHSVRDDGLAYDPESDFLLGVRAGTPIFVRKVPAALDDFEAQMRHVSLRIALSSFGDADVEFLMRAQGLTQFHNSHPYCPACGASTMAFDWGRSRVCKQCEIQHFPRVDPAVIVAVTDAHGRLLLGHHVGWEEGRHSIFAGFVETGESAEQAVRREVREEVGLDVWDVAYGGSQPWPMPRSLMLGFWAQSGGEPDPDGQEILSARWFTRTELDEAVESGEVVLPPQASIAFRFINQWRRVL